MGETIEGVADVGGGVINSDVLFTCAKERSNGVEEFAADTMLVYFMEEEPSCRAVKGFGHIAEEEDDVKVWLIAVSGLVPELVDVFSNAYELEVATQVPAAAELPIVDGCVSEVLEAVGEDRIVKFRDGVADGDWAVVCRYGWVFVSSFEGGGDACGAADFGEVSSIP